jgi:N-acetylglucosaminyltransferase
MRNALGIAAGFCAQICLAAALAVGGERIAGTWLPFAAVGAAAGAIAVWRRVLAGRYRPVAPGHREPVSVVAPTFREDPIILEASISSWLDAGVAEVVLVFSDDEQSSIRRARASHGRDPRVRILTTPNPAKRQSLAIGIREARHDIVVLSDSDTLWPADLLDHLIAPFADPRVGGVGTRQRVIDAGSSIWRRAAQSLLDAKYTRVFPAMAVQGGVSLLSGRTAAYRRGALLAAIPGLLGETFRGRSCVSGDDGRISWLVLSQGYRTTFQASAVVETMMPGSGGAFVRQRTRHGRNDYRRYLSAIKSGWLWRQPLITQVTVLQKLVEPCAVGLAAGMSVAAVASGEVLALLASQAWILHARGIGPAAHVRGGVRAIGLLPVVAGLIGYVTVIVKFYAFATMARQGWGTRRHDAVVADGQSSATLSAPLALRVRPADGGAG